MATKTGIVRPTPILRSTEGPTTRPCRLRFVNNFLYAVDVFWIDHDGEEKKYATVQPRGQSPQGTYTTHAWRVRENGTGRLLGTYVGEEATVEMTPAAACLVHKGFNSGQAFGRKKLPSAWGKFQQRGEAKGIPVKAYDCVSDEAVVRAEHVLEGMLDATPPGMLERLHQNQADVVVIGFNQAASDMPMHSFLEGQDADFEQRACTNSLRGVGGSWTVPTASTGEENLLMDDDDVNYPCESTLIHHFAHSVMSVAMNEDQRQAVISAYFNARARQLYRTGSSVLGSADEYWAHGSQAWFEATCRTDVNDGINTRQKLRRHDPQLALLLQHAFGDGEWRYQKTSPSLLFDPGKRREDSYSRSMQAKAARYNLCCWPSWAAHLWPSQHDKSSQKIW